MEDDSTANDDSASVSSIEEIESEFESVSEIETDNQSNLDLETEFQVNGAVEALQQIDGLKPETWQSLDATSRLETLQTIENRMASIQGRPEVAITSEPLGPNTYGGYNGEGIIVNSNHINSDMAVDEHIDTIVHEGRHAYQDYAIHNPGFVPDTELTNAWYNNRLNYLNAEEVGQEAYMAQPIEADAWNYASHIVDGLHQSRQEKL